MTDHEFLTLALFLTPAQCAEVLGVSVSLIRAMLRDGRLRARRLRGSRLIRVARVDLEALLEPANEEPSVDRVLRLCDKGTA